MATVTSTPTAGSLSVSGTTQKSGTITWSKPTVPSGATISSCVLTGTATASMSKGSATVTVNGTTVTAGSQFTINLGTSNNTTSVNTTVKGSNKNAKGTVSFSNLVYTVTYTEPVSAQKNTYIFDANEDCGYVVANGQTYRGKTVRVEVGLNEELSFTIYPNSGYIISSVNIGVMNDNWNSESPYSMSIDGNGNYFGEATISIVYTEKVEEILLNTVIINSNEDWGYVKDLTTNEIHTGTNITVTGPNTEDIDLMIYPNEGYHIASVYEDKFGEDVGPFTQYPCGLAQSVGSNTQTYTYVVTYAKNIVQYTVTFKDWDGTTLKTQTVEEGSSATAPSNPSRNGYNFTGWDKSFNNITTDLTVTAQYEKIRELHLIAKYTANAAGVVPDFNSGYQYEINETESDGIYTVEITSEEDFSTFKFRTNKTNLIGIEYLNVTSAVTSLDSSFYGCYKLEYINGIDKWDISNSSLTRMYSLFNDCTSLSTIDLSSLNNHNISKMMSAFNGCNSLKSVNLDGFINSSVTDINYLFYDCERLETIIMNNCDLSNAAVNSSFSMNTRSLKNIEMKNTNYTSVNKVISDLPTRTSEDPGTLNIEGVDDPSQVDITTARSKFWNVVGGPEEPEPDDNVLLVYKFDNTIETINNYLPLFVPDTFNYTYEDVIKGNIITRTIYSDTKPTQIYIHGTANETVANSSILDVLYVNINGMTTLAELFAGLTNVQKLDVSNFDISNVTDIKDMFHNCKSLISLDVSNFNTGNVADMSGMFNYCESLISLDLSNFDTSNVTTISRLARNCTSLESINLSNWNLNNLNYNSNVFYNCDNLVNITMQNSDYNSVNKIIAELPTRTSESPGTLNVTGVYDFSQVDITTAESKCWNVINEQPEEPGESKTLNLIIGDEIINELFIGEQEIKEIYLGDNLLFKK